MAFIYKDFARYDAAKRRIRFDAVRYGAVTGPKPPAHYGAARYVRVEGPTPEARDEFSALDDTVIFGRFDGDKVVWPCRCTRGRNGERHGDGRADRPGDRERRRRRARAVRSLPINRRLGHGSDNGNVWYDHGAGAARRSRHAIAVRGRDDCRRDGDAVAGTKRSMAGRSHSAPRTRLSFLTSA